MKRTYLPRMMHFCTRSVGMISLPHGKWLRVDPRDFKKVTAHSWSMTGKGYVVGFVDGKLVEVSRWLTEAKPNEIVDHWNGDTLDNTRGNLRICNKAQNNANAVKRAAATSHFKGVTKLPNGRFRARCSAGSLGIFDTEIEAAAAYDRAMRSLFGRFACVNLPRKGERCAIPATNTCAFEESEAA